MSWQRLESSTVGADLLEGPEARVADALWLVGRQWQVGELTGEDAASPALIEAAVAHTPITRFRPGPPAGGGPVVERGAGGLPLETAVEREGVRDGPAAPRLAAEAGLQLRRLLTAAEAPDDLLASLRRAFPLRLPPGDGLDPVGRLQLELLARRSLDAPALAAALAGGPRAADLPPIPAGDVRDAVDAWEAWYAGLVSEPGAGTRSWDPRRMEYRFQVAAGAARDREIQLDAPEYAGGRLDWDAFDVAAKPPDMGARGGVQRHDLRVLPTPARFAGQAASRWWQLEDASVWFGDLAAAPEDLARAVLGSYGMLFGDDWFLVPCGLPAGVLARGIEVKVLDDFGGSTPVRSIAEKDGPGRVWRFFELTGDASADAPVLKDRRCPWTLLPPALAGTTESEPVEEVVLRRDEVANLGWAAERRVESAAGRPVDRVARALAAAAPPPEAPEGAWRYLLATSVPEHQVPLVPVVSAADGGLYLQRGRMEVAAGRGGVETRGAIGRILEPETALLIHDCEVPDTGVAITRTWQMARRGDGGHVLWVGRRKRPARPQRTPRLVFDEVIREG